MVGSSAQCTPTASDDTFAKITPGNSLTCSASITLTQADLEAEVINILAYASSSTQSSAGVATTAVAELPVKLTPQPILQLDLDVLADTCVLETANATGT